MRVLAKVAVVAVALGVMGSAAKAQQVDIRITTSDRGYTNVGSRFDGDEFGRGRYGAPRQGGWDDHDGPRHAAPSRYGHDYRDPDRYYGRPVPERGFWNRHGYGHPVVARRHWDRHDDCRIVVKRIVSAWGHVTIKQKQVCD